MGPVAPPRPDVLYINKWYTFAACALLQLLMGVQYCFPIYAGDLKEMLGYTQTQIQGIMSPIFISAVVGWLPGIFYDSLERQHRMGPRVTILIGLAMHCLGHTGLWAVATRRMTLPYWQVVVLAMVAFNGGGWVDTATLATNIRNYPNARGIVVGILKSFVGLSGSIFTSVYTGVFKPHVLSFLRFLSIGPPLIGLVAVIFVNHVPLKEGHPPQQAGAVAEQADGCSDELGQPGSTVNKRFKVVYAIVILLASYQLANSAFASADSRTIRERHLLLLGDLLLLLPLLLLPLGSRLFVWRTPPPIIEAPQETVDSSGSHRIGTESDTRIRAWGPANVEISAGAMKLGPASQACGSSQSYVLHAVQCIEGGAAEFDGEHESPRSADAVSLDRHGRPTVKSRPVPATLTGSHSAVAGHQSGTNMDLQNGRAYEPSKRSQPIPIQSKKRPHACDDTLAASEPRAGESLAWHPQHSSNGAHTADRDSVPQIASFQKPDQLPQSTRSLSDDAAHCSLARGATPSTAYGVGSRAGAAPNLSPLQCTRSLDFWLLFTVFGANAGCGLLLINNIGQIVQSLGGPDDGHDVFVSLFSVMNAVGRLTFGFVPELLMHNFQTPRTIFLILAALMMSLVCGGTSLAESPGSLAVWVIGGGFSYGGFWGLMPAIASEMFGLPHFASNYCVLSFSTAITAYFLGTKLAGSLYSAAAAAHGGPLDVCMGVDCFGTTFALAGGLAACTTVMAAALTVRTRGLYCAPRQLQQGPLQAC